jgi:tetratricopeptide (TPR) repeat protein
MASKPKKPVPAAPKAKPVGKIRKPVRTGFVKRNSFAIGLFLITFIVFANGIGNNYALDDEFYTAGGNKLTQKGFRGIPEIFRSHTFYNNDGSGYSYRPVALVTFAIENQFFGENPHISHFISILLYAICVVLIFSVLRKWFVTQGDWFSFFICLLFLVHPLHTEVVDNIKCRDELLTLLFMLLTIRALWKHMETRRWIFLLLYPLFFVAGMLSKQTAIPFYFLIPLSLWFFTKEEDWEWKKENQKKLLCVILYASVGILLLIGKKYLGIIVLGMATGLWFVNPKIWKIALYLFPIIILSGLSAFFQKHNLEAETRNYLAFENPLVNHPHFAELSATSFYVAGRYLFLHFIPYPLVYYYGSFYVPTVTWSNPIAIVSLLIHIALGIWALFELRKKSILGYGLLFYLINIAAYSNFVTRAPGIMAERFTFAASLGFCIVIVTLIFRYLKSQPSEFRWSSEHSRKAKFIFLTIAALFAIKSFIRTEDWENKETLYGGDMETLRESVKANMLYGALISKNALEANFESHVSDGKGGQRIDKQKQQEAMALFTEARSYYKKAADLAPYYHTAWSNLGTTYFFTGDPKTALPYFLRGVKEKADYAEGWFNVGMAYDKLDNPDSAFYAFRQSIKSDSSYVASYEQLSRLIMQQDQDPQAALVLLRKAAKHKPDSEVPWMNMANIYIQLKDTASSATSLEMAARINPHNVQRLYNLADYFRVHGDVSKYNQYTSLAEAERKKQEKQQKKQQEKKQDN